MTTDRRILRTRDALGDALVALIREIPFEEITVQQILDRAGVGRSTFYTHFRDKDDLFLSDVEDLFEYFSTALTRTGADPRRLAPVRELFAHILDVRVFYAALVTSGKINDVIALGRGIFARSIEERLRLTGASMGASASRSPSAGASAIAGAGPVASANAVASGVLSASADASGSAGASAPASHPATPAVDPGITTAAPHLAPLAHALSGSLFSLLDWWTDHGMQAPPEDMDALFHRMAWRGVSPRPRPPRQP